MVDNPSKRLFWPAALSNLGPWTKEGPIHVGRPLLRRVAFANGWRGAPGALPPSGVAWRGRGSSRRRCRENSLAAIGAGGGAGGVGDIGGDLSAGLVNGAVLTDIHAGRGSDPREPRMRHWPRMSCPRRSASRRRPLSRGPARRKRGLAGKVPVLCSIWTGNDTGTLLNQP